MPETSAHRHKTYPGGKAFAFTIVDDTDGGTIANTEPVYRLLDDLGIKTTKTVWVQRSSTPDRFDSFSQTLEDRDYLRFVLELQRKGFEIAMHMAAPGSSRRPETIAAYRRFKETFGHHPRINANHSANREGMYWGQDRFDSPLLRTGYAKMTSWGQFRGHEDGNEFFWGDICQQYTRYVRNFTFRGVNTLKINPSMPYHDPRRPYVNYWFSSSDGADVSRFNALISERNQERLERERGCCIVYTHFGSDFVQDGALNETWERGMSKLAERDGWFVPASQLLDFLLEQRQEHGISRAERTYLSHRWMLERVWERLRTGGNSTLWHGRPEAALPARGAWRQEEA